VGKKRRERDNHGERVKETITGGSKIEEKYTNNKKREGTGGKVDHK